MHAQLEAIRAEIKELLRHDPFRQLLAPEYLRRAVFAYPDRGGKMLRPALLLGSCGVFKQNTRPALPVAAAVEIFHIWTLVHDDIIDDDDCRRGGPSVHCLVRDLLQDPGGPVAARFGVNLAILAGDVQQAWSNRLILNATEVPAEIRLSLLERLNGLVNPLLISGEAMDVEFELRPFAAISPGEMETMLRRKTAVLLRFAAESGAMIGLNTGDCEEPRVKLLGDFAEAAGLAFQLRDDVLGMFGDEAELGKPVGSDLRQGKRNYLFTVARKRLSGKELAVFEETHGNPQLTGEQCRAVAEMLRDCGALAATEAKAAEYLETALARLAELPANDYTGLVRDWAMFVCHRTT